ncbi:hypothetical protein HGRIS_001815 [Hohenbuehelia grisea]|uniref:Transcription factor domain-containing protein n=1 Tax=Hohenbuehelia grisea TaxID=104357 RepID=A0ABR3JIJ0_9AGAR
MWELKHASMAVPPMPDWLIFFGIMYFPNQVDIVAHRWVQTSSSFQVVSDIVESFTIGRDGQHTRGIDDLLDLAMCLMTLQGHVFRLTALWEDFTWPWADFNSCYNSVYGFVGYWTPSPSEAAEREGIVLHIQSDDDTPLVDDRSSWSASLEEKLNSRQSVADWVAHVSAFDPGTGAESTTYEDASIVTPEDPQLPSSPDTVAPSGFLNLYAMSASAMTARPVEQGRRVSTADGDIMARFDEMTEMWYSRFSRLPIQIPRDLSNHSDASQPDEIVWTTLYSSIIDIIRHSARQLNPDVQLKSVPPPPPAPDFFRALDSDRIRKSFLALFLCFPQMLLFSASNKALTEGFLVNVFGLQTVSASFSSVLKPYISLSQPEFSPVLALVEHRARMWRERVLCNSPLPQDLPDSTVAHYAALESLAPFLKYMIWMFYFHHPDMYPWLLADNDAKTRNVMLPKHYLLHSFTVSNQSCSLDLYWPSLGAIVDGIQCWNLHSQRVET